MRGPRPNETKLLNTTSTAPQDAAHTLAEIPPSITPAVPRIMQEKQHRLLYCGILFILFFIAPLLLIASKNVSRYLVVSVRGCFHYTVVIVSRGIIVVYWHSLAPMAMHTCSDWDKGNFWAYTRYIVYFTVKLVHSAPENTFAQATQTWCYFHAYVKLSRASPPPLRRRLQPPPPSPAGGRHRYCGPAATTMGSTDHSQALACLGSHLSTG